MNMRNTGLLFAVLAAAVPACSSDDNSATDAGAAADAGGTAAATLSASTAALGAHLLDKDGKTLYFYVKDVAGSGVSACDATCQTKWKLADLGTTTTVGTGLTAADFTTTTAGGQTAWKGRPLYYFLADTTTGATGGEAVGGLWFVARAYNLFFAVDATVDATAVGGADKTTPFLTAGNGRAIYVFSTETPATATTPPVTKCGPTDGTGTTVGACAKKWPLWAKPATLTTDPVVPSTLKASDLSSFNAESSMVQFTYKGWPTYFYAPLDTSTPPVNVPEAAGKKGGALVASWYAVAGAWDGKTF